MLKYFSYQYEKKALFLIALFSVGFAHAEVYPMQFSIAEEKIVKEIPHKDLDFAPLIPGKLSTYIYTKESDYRRDYQRSYFAVTCKKGGWDCMRHYEILANGCIPYFVNLDECDCNTMYFLPKSLIKEAMNLPGVSYMSIDHEKFDKVRYFEILNQLLEHTRQYLTTKNMAAYLLGKINYSGRGKILFLSNSVAPDYMRCSTLAGLKELLGDRIVDVPKIEHIYKNYSGKVEQLDGKGFSYTKTIEDIPVDRSNIEQRIRNGEFDLIIYGSVHRGLRFHGLVVRSYSPDKIIYLCGEDAHRCTYTHSRHLFLREFEAL